MERRALLKLSSVYAMGMPLLLGRKFRFAETKQWQAWLQLLLEPCEIESKYGLFYTGVLPNEELFGFAKATDKYYFYNRGQFCFTILEKNHDSLGLLELAIPVWKRESSGNWKKLTCLSLFELEALAKAASILAKSKEDNIGDYVLPIAKANKIDESFTTAQGVVSVKSKVEEKGILTSVRVLNKQELILQDEFRSCHCLTCEI
ncbi:MAG: hypothetical protein IPJ74_14840 [Saprospiraceae bacterium]|nr:hypothetical protein [Saprospiraceae bacterium]